MTSYTHDTPLASKRTPPEVIDRIIKLSSKGLSRPKIAELLNADEVPTATGLRWTSSHIRNVLRRRGLTTKRAKTLDERFDRNVKPTKSGCALWTGHVRRNAGRFKISSSRGIEAHRYAYERANGPIPGSAHLLNVCGRRDCVEPSHWVSSGSPEHFRAYVEVDEESGCHRWTGQLNYRGYGLFQYRDSDDGCTHRMKAHRVAYEQHYGSIPDGYQIHHSCDNPACVNPLHVTAVRDTSAHVKLAKAEKEIEAAFEDGSLYVEAAVYAALGQIDANLGISEADLGLTSRVGAAPAGEALASYGGTIDAVESLKAA